MDSSLSEEKRGKRMKKKRSALDSASSVQADIDEVAACREMLFGALQHCRQSSSGMSDILNIYLASTELSEDRNKINSIQCQKMLWRIAQSNQWTDEILIFADHLYSMATDPQWNFLIQHVITLCSRSQLEVFCERLFGRTLDLAKHVIGCRLLCRICEQGRFSMIARRLLQELSGDMSTLIMHRFGNFVVLKILEHFDNFPGVEEAVTLCAQRPWKHGVALAVLAMAADKRKLKAVHYTIIAARGDFEVLQTLRQHGKIVYDATQAHQAAGLVDFAEKLCAALEVVAKEGNRDEHEEASNLTDIVEADTPEELAFPVYTSCNQCVPLFRNWYTSDGLFVGAYLYGYQFIEPASPMILPPSDHQPHLVQEASPTSLKTMLRWSLPARDVKRLFIGGPPTLHLGIERCSSHAYSMDLVAMHEETNNGDSIKYQAALKLAHVSMYNSSDRATMIGFEGESPVYHNFSHHVFISSPMTLVRSKILEMKEDFTFKVSLCTF